MATAMKKKNPVVVEEEETQRYRVTATVTISWESEAETYEQAEEDGWNWGDHLDFAETYSIEVEEM